MWKALRATRHGAAAPNTRRKLQKSASPASPPSLLRAKTGDIVEEDLLVVSRAARVSLAEGVAGEDETARRTHDEGMTGEAAAAPPESQPLAQPRHETSSTTTTTIDNGEQAVQDNATTTTAVTTVLGLGDSQRDEGPQSPSLSPSPALPALVRPDIPSYKTNSNSSSSSTFHSLFPSASTLASSSLSISNSSSSPSTSTTSLSIYPPDEIHHMAFDILKRTRAKTPCFWVGQLDHPKQPYDNVNGKNDNDDGRYDSAIALACEYQAVLPPRTFTPASIAETHQPLGRTIRKVKGRQSLRDIVEREDEESESVYSSGSNSNYGYGYSDTYASYNHYNHVHHTSINIHNHYSHNHNYTQTSCSSDSDTLVGSDSPSSPLTPSSAYFPSQPPSKSSPPPMISILPPIPPPHDPSSLKAPSFPAQAQTHTSPAFQLCLDLLTGQLAQGLFKKHPAEPLDRASGLQIRLMIEAYESVLDHLREGGPDNDGLDNKSTEDMQHTLDHWIAALYSVYERTIHDDVCSVDSWTSCRSHFSAVDIACGRE